MLVQFNTTKFTALDANTYPVQSFEDLNMTTRVDPEAPYDTSFAYTYNKIRFNDYRGQLEMNFLKFSALNSSGTDVATTSVFVPFPDTAISSLLESTVTAVLEAQATGKEIGVVQCTVGFIFAGKLNPKLPGYLLWDPDALLLFTRS
jgi:hypothetical protein